MKITHIDFGFLFKKRPDNTDVQNTKLRVELPLIMTEVSRGMMIALTLGPRISNPSIPRLEGFSCEMWEAEVGSPDHEDNVPDPAVACAYVVHVIAPKNASAEQINGACKMLQGFLWKDKDPRGGQSDFVDGVLKPMLAKRNLPFDVELSYLRPDEDN